VGFAFHPQQALYAAAFDWIVSRINAKLDTGALLDTLLVTGSSAGNIPTSLHKCGQAWAAPQPRHVYFFRCHCWSTEAAAGRLAWGVACVVPAGKKGSGLSISILDIYGFEQVRQM
jgi:hypothetical protein